MRENPLVKRQRKAATTPEPTGPQRALDSQRAVGTTNRQRLKWLIDFANTDIQSPRRSPEELENLDWQVNHFVDGGVSHGAGAMEYSTPSPELDLVHLRNHALYGLHEVAKVAVERGPKDPPGVVNRAAWDGWNPNAISIGNTRPPLDGLVRIVRRGFSAYSGPRLAVFLTAVADLIASEEGKRIQECAAKDCTAIFYRWKRGLYCSKKCSQRARVQRYRNKSGAGS
jgi:hypothetical protein